MTGFLVHVGASIICPHGGQILPSTSNTRVLVSGQPVVTLSDTYPIVACSLTAAAATGGPPPCVTTQWSKPSLRITINEQPAILADSIGVCQNPARSSSRLCNYCDYTDKSYWDLI